MPTRIVTVWEHKNLPQLMLGENLDCPQEFWLPRKIPGKPVFLFDINIEGNLGYHIGLDWFKEGEIALECRPKIMNLDFMTMFQACLKDRRALSYLGQIYHVDTKSPRIPSRRPHDEINAIVALHFLTVMVDLIKRPLKKDYIRRNENLTARIKGKIDLPKHLKSNILGQRPDRMYCNYQEYTTDCYDNRLLHSAYEIACAYLSNQKFNLPRHLQLSQQAIQQTLSQIGFLSSFAEMHKVKSNPLYREYGEAIRLAKLLYRIKGYRHRISETRMYEVPPYTINMSLLFELFVFQMLPQNGILFQQPVNYGKPDFLDVTNCRVLDAKYKTWYVNPSASDMAEDMRQLAGYARDKGTHQTFGLDDPQIPIPCVIIYPHHDGCTDLNTYWKSIEEIYQFQNFYKVGVKLPVRETCLAND